ncbi:MAG: AAA family ATPase, partial [Pseudomonadota bacterium]
MKILELRFKNLNSLYGEWLIDFTHPVYETHGIFAMTGPTGAGKSTILDAICLALYGATPRLGRITKSSNEIMSRQTGECYAEVVFESQVGRFRCHWEQRRARKQAEGNLQEQEHQIAHANSGQLIETKKSLVLGVVEQKTGMDFERFTRSILLAQGGFDNFLKADVEQKSKILEQLTGTEIYSSISRRVHERQREEREQLNLLQAEISGITLLDAEQEKVLVDELAIMQREAEQFKTQKTKMEQAIAWLNTIEVLKKELAELADARIKHEEELEAFKPQGMQLKLANKAASLDSEYAELNAIRQQLRDDEEIRNTQKEQMPNLERASKLCKNELEVAEKTTFQSKMALDSAASLLKQVRSLDKTIDEKTERLIELTQACESDVKKIQIAQESRKTENEKKVVAEQEQQRTHQYLVQHQSDEILVSEIVAIEEQFNYLENLQNDIEEKQKSLNKIKNNVELADKQLYKSTQEYMTQEKALTKASRDLHQNRELLENLLNDRHLREYRAEKDNLLREMAFIQKITQLEAQRAQLETGKPCPLCGAKEHPFIQDDISVPNDVEQKIHKLEQLIAQAERQEARIKQSETEETLLKQTLNVSEKQKF